MIKPADTGAGLTSLTVLGGYEARRRRARCAPWRALRFPAWKSIQDLDLVRAADLLNVNAR